MPLIDAGKPLRTVLRWQAYATAFSMLTAGVLVGFHGALSALLGGLVNIAAGAVFGWVAARSAGRSTGGAVVAVIRAEALKVLLIVAQLWAVLALYKNIVPAAFFATFVLTVIVFSMAIFVRDR